LLEVDISSVGRMAAWSLEYDHQYIILVSSSDS